MSEMNEEDDLKLLRETIKNYFPLSAWHDFEAVLNKHFYPIGINQNYPAELRERLLAASISFFAGNKSIDYTRKKYTNDIQYEEDPGGDQRQDRKIRTACLFRVRVIIDGLVSFNSNEPEVCTIGKILGDATLTRIPYSLERAFAEGDKGALFESLVIIRMALEQLCWALSIQDHDDPDIIRTTSVTKSITHISKLYPRLGRLNGWLSKHAHWNYDAHIKAILETPGSVIISSHLFKGCSYFALIIFSELFFKIISEELKEFIDWDEVSKKLELQDKDQDFNFGQESEALKKLLEPFYPDLNKLIG